MSGTARRYSALAYIGLSVIVFWLPSRLNVPRSDPSAVAGYAPVPGGSQGSGDISELGAAAGGGLGSRRVGSGDATAEMLRPVPTPPQGPAGVKRCIGTPPRQTEDPLSPPCVAYFEGDNGGATHRGVTGEEVAVVAYVTAEPTGRTFDYGKPPQEGEVEQDAVFRAFQNHFNVRYQTYGRFVHFYGFHGGTSAQPDPVLRSWVREANDKLRPFAYLVPSSDFQRTLIDEAARLDMMAVAYSSFDRATHQRYQPRFITFSPDRQDEASMAASYVCRKLNGRTAKHSGNALDVDTLRRFGLLYADELYARLIKGELGRQCGLDPPEAGGPEDNVATAVAKLRTANVTTVIAVGSNGSVLLWTNAAAGQGWSPEWVTTGDTFTAQFGRLYPQNEWRHAFGVMFDYRRDEIGRQPWYAAFQEGCGGCPPPSASQGNISRIYDGLTMLFYGIQAAGPRLTPESFDKGLHAIPPSTSTSPYRPSAYFAPGNYSFMKDTMEIWWDPAGQQPGVAEPGCYRLSNEGRRFRTGEWLEGDGDVFRPGQPCQGPDAP